MKRKNMIRLIISIVSTIVLLLGSTYALLNFLTDKTDVVMTVGGDRITFNAGTNIKVEGLFPTYSMYSETNVITKEIELYKENGDYTAGIDLYLNLKSWPSVMSSPSFRWVIYKNGNYLNSGDFSSTKQGNNIKLTSNPQSINLVEDKDIYKLYMWIDAYQESSSDMMNRSFTVSLYGQATFYDYNEDPIINEVEPNAPDLADSMIPIKYNYVIDEWVKADSTNTDNDWYDYYNKMWANAVMVESDKREKYMNASVGTTVNEDDILAYYVWIPRYKYVLFNTQFVKIDPVEIQIEFQNETDEIFNGTQNGQYLTHPAFWWDNDSDGIRDDGEELAGIWVGKFETTGTVNNPTIKPNMLTARDLNVYELFYLNRKFEGTEYLTETGISQVDSHMMKNIEWGAVAYLSHSKYGKNKEVSINNSSYITGRHENYTYNDYIVRDGKITSNKEAGTGVLASTTGNVYGVYDMSGGSVEYVMAIELNSNGTLWYDKSGFNDNNIVDSKYYDLYAYGQSGLDFSRSKLGDATGETNNWYGDGANFLSSSSWFIRGGEPGGLNVTGVFFFSCQYATGQASARFASRAVLLSD